MKSHGSGQACSKDRITPRCEECLVYERERSRVRKRTPGTYAYKAIHGIGEPGEKRRESEKRRSRTPGTYRYKAANRIGEPGEVARAALRRQVRTPGTYKYKAVHGIGRAGEMHRRTVRRANRRTANTKDQAALDALIAEVEGRTYGPTG